MVEERILEAHATGNRYGLYPAVRPQLGQDMLNVITGGGTVDQ